MKLAIMEQIDNSGIFHYTLNLSEPARLEYKFIVDGEWKLDPLCHNVVDNGVGGQNSYFVVGEFHEPPELEAVESIPHGRVEEFEFASERLGNRRAVYVYLPPGYDAHAAPLPALYVHDGGEYLSRARLPVVLDNLIHAGEVAPLIAVMVDPVNRMTEYRMNERLRGFRRLRVCTSYRRPLPHARKLGGARRDGRVAGRPDLALSCACAAGSVFQGRKPVGRVSAGPGSNPRSGP